MPHLFTAKQRIAKPPLVVWGQLADVRMMPKWMSGVSSIETADETGDLGQGSTLVFKARGSERTAEVIDCEATSLLTIRSAQGQVVATYRYTLEPDGNGTRVELNAECDVAGAARLLFPLIKLAVRLSDGGQLRRLKRVAEKI